MMHQTINLNKSPAFNGKLPESKILLPVVRSKLREQIARLKLQTFKVIL